MSSGIIHGVGGKPPLYGVERGLGVSTFIKPFPPGARLTGVSRAGKRGRGSLNIEKLENISFLCQLSSGRYADTLFKGYNFKRFHYIYIYDT